MANSVSGVTTVLNGMPWWVKAFAYVGFPVAAACFLAYIVFAMLQPHVF